MKDWPDKQHAAEALLVTGAVRGKGCDAAKEPQCGMLNTHQEGVQNRECDSKAGLTLTSYERDVQRSEKVTLLLKSHHGCAIPKNSVNKIPATASIAHLHNTAVFAEYNVWLSA